MQHLEARKAAHGRPSLAESVHPCGIITVQLVKLVNAHKDPSHDRTTTGLFTPSVGLLTDRQAQLPTLALLQRLHLRHFGPIPPPRDRLLDAPQTHMQLAQSRLVLVILVLRECLVYWH